MTRYEQGFLSKCAEYGMDGRAFLEKRSYAIPKVDLAALYSRLRKLPVDKLRLAVARSKNMPLPSFAASNEALQRAAATGNTKAVDTITRNLNWVSKGNRMESPSQIISRFRNNRSAIQDVYQRALDDSVAATRASPKAEVKLPKKITVHSAKQTSKPYPSFYETMMDWSVRQNPEWSEELARMI